MTDQRKVTLAPHKGQSCLRDLPLLSIDKQDRTDRNGQKTSPPNQHLRLVASLSTYLCQQSLAHRNPGYMNPLHHGPHDGQTACFRRKRVDLISSLPHVAEKAGEWHWSCGCSDA